ncbi:Calmegin [Microtus ochrogaster]|uniref:Calmegin n=1 Tax=Microtus ochrogaster TaxID=79684 RepID=A0A8J6GK96_MICOH|nr:Calmegin [Microtus ochrogaster]
MRFQSVGLCLGLLAIAVNAEFVSDGVEVGDASENSEESSIKEDEPSSGTIKYKTPLPIGEVYFTETFDSGRLPGWVLSKAKKDDKDSEISIYDGRWEIEELKEDQVPGDRGLVLKSKAKHHAISAVLNKPFIFSDRPLIVQ